jgi:hypothetical protein
MKQTTIPCIPALADLYAELISPPQAHTEKNSDKVISQARTLLKQTVPEVDISACTWRDSESDVPDKPLGTVKVRLKMGYSGTILGLLYTLEGVELLARYTRNWDMVCRDSCVECFIASEPNNPAYVNLEFNPLGTCWAQTGTDREHREKLSLKALSAIFRRGFITTSSMDTGGLDGKSRVRWEMLILFPMQEVGVLANTIKQLAFARSGACEGNMLKGTLLRANFYTTGDDLQKPVYQSWCAIDTPHPDFHQPDYFGEVVFGE